MVTYIFFHLDGLRQCTWYKPISLSCVVLFLSRQSVLVWGCVSGCGGLASSRRRPGGYLWFISGHSSKKPVDAASLSHPLCPSHCFSIGLPSVPGECGPARPMLPSWPWSYSGHMLCQRSKRMSWDLSHSAIWTTPSYLAGHLAAPWLVLQLACSLSFYGAKFCHKCSFNQLNHHVRVLPQITTYTPWHFIEKLLINCNKM